MTISIRRPDPFTNLPKAPVGEEGFPKRYPVMCIQPKAGDWEYLHGYIVTHMNVQDYCDMHGLTLVEVFRGTRGALSGERTELF